MKQQTLHMIGNGHLDPVWLWQWPEGFQAVKATFRSALDRMKEGDDFLFTSSSAGTYEWVQHNDPAMFQEIKSRVAEGRWQIVGGWWNQPDCNIPGGESYVRQGLYGQRWFQEHLGVTARVGYNVDSFGHHGMLPQILKKSGLDFYVMMRPSPQEMGMPGRLFWWESDDGSRVLTFRIPYEYNTWGKEVDNQVRRCAGELKSPYDDLMCFYGVGNHGGGPTVENIESIRRLNDEPDLPALVFSTPDRFFDTVSAKDLPFPVVHSDLQHHASGCYAAHSGVKRWNRQAENLLITAEKFSSLATLTTRLSYPTQFVQAWKSVLFNQFHDILAGTSLPAAYDDARDMYGEAMSSANRALYHAIQSLSWNIDIPSDEGMTPIVVFNPHSWSSKVDVELEFGGHKEGDILVDDVGTEVALQVVRPTVIVSGWRKRLSFVADLPAFGYRVYRVVPGPAQASIAPITATDHVLENDRFRLTFDPATGYIASLYDKQQAVETFVDAGARPVVIDDPSDTWSHGVTQFQNIVGAFTATRIKRVEHGPVKSVIRVESAYGQSRLVQEFTMYRELEHIEVRVTVDWHEQWKMLKLQFPLNLNFLRATYEIPYGFIERPANGEEEPGQSWIDLSGGARGSNTPYGLSVLNDGKYSFDVNGRVMSLTILRSPVFAHHVPTTVEPGETYEFIDQGIQRFTYTLLPHADSWEQARTVRRAAELNQRPVAIAETYHAGSLPQMASFLSVDHHNVIASVIKQAEDNDDLVLRCYETDRVATETTIRLPEWNRTIRAKWGPCEIKTFRIPRDPASVVVETDLIERGA